MHTDAFSKIEDYYCLICSERGPELVVLEFHPTLSKHIYTGQSFHKECLPLREIIKERRTKL